VYLEKHLTYFRQTFSTGAFWDMNERFKFWDEKVKVQGHGVSSVLENALLVLLMRYLESYWTEFRRTFSTDAFCDRNEGVSFGGQRSKIRITA